LFDYVQRRNWLTQPIDIGTGSEQWHLHLTRYTPWELVRIDRALRLQIVAALVNNGGLRDKRAMAINIFYDRQTNNRSVFDMQTWADVYWNLPRRIEWRISATRMNQVHEAIEKWYVDHDRTLPESLDTLVEASYLDEVPVHPFTKEAATFHRNALLPKKNDPDYHYLSFYPMSVHVLGRSSDKKLDWKEEREYIDAFRQSGGTYLQLGGRIVVLIEREETADDRPQTAVEKETRMEVIRSPPTATKSPLPLGEG